MGRPTTTRLRAVALGAAAATLGSLVALAAPTTAHAEDAMCRTTPGSNPFYPGPSASATYDSTFHKSVAVPSGLLDDRYVPQGLAYWNDWKGTTEDVLLISAYQDSNGDKDPDGPSGVFGVVLSGERRGTGLGRMLIAQTHAGGLAIAGGHVYVGGEGIVRWWSTDVLRNQLEGPNSPTTVPPKGTQNVAGKASFLGKQGGKIWTGDFDENAHASMWQYDPAADGSLTYTGEKRWVPKKTQGMAVVDGHFVFGTSFGRDNRSNVWVRPTSLTSDITDATSFCMRAPSMIEGLAYGTSNGNSHLWAVYESGSYTYRDSLNPITHVHWAEGSTVAGLYGQAD